MANPLAVAGGSSAVGIKSRDLAPPAMKMNLATLQGQAQAREAFFRQMQGNVTQMTTPEQQGVARAALGRGYTPIAAGPTITHVVDPKNGDIKPIGDVVPPTELALSAQLKLPANGGNDSSFNLQGAGEVKADLSTLDGQRKARMDAFAAMNANRGAVVSKEQKAVADQVFDRGFIPMMSGQPKITHVMNPDSGEIKTVDELLKGKKHAAGWSAYKSA